MMQGFQLYRVTGGPEWIRTDRYDIVAKAGRDVAPEDQYKLVMSLLNDRLHLQSHTEMRTKVPGFVLRAKRLPAAVKPAAADEKYSARPDGPGSPFMLYSHSAVRTHQLPFAADARTGHGRNRVRKALCDF